MLTIHKVVNDQELEKFVSRDTFVEFMQHHLGKFGDTPEALHKCLDFAFKKGDGLGGFALVAYYEDNLVGGLIMNNTGMGGYIPDNILVYVAVDASYRNKGFGRQIVNKGIELAEGDVKLHVELDNPAKRLYERVGFTNKYAEMRFKK